MSMINSELAGKSGSDNVHLEFTLPPGKQQVYYIERSAFYKQQMARANVMTSLHQKYGQEIYEEKNGGVLYWLFDGGPPDPARIRTLAEARTQARTAATPTRHPRKCVP